MAVRIGIHGHFYQPPREDPWTGKIGPHPDAAPYPDWNERVHAESYEPNTAATIPSHEGELTVNNLERMSFNFGPTLMPWLEKFHPQTYERIIEADRVSIERLGHGNAIAQAFHHTILPLATVRDIRTEVRWGLADFAHRFGRQAEGMWLPETAANDAVLAVLIEEAVAFTILAPHQAAAWRDPEGLWHNASLEPIDPRRPYRFEHPDGSGRSLAIFYFDDTLARQLAFEKLTASAEKLIDAFCEAAASTPDDLDDPFVFTATDGETFGHHQEFAEIGLAYALFVEADERSIEVTNLAAHLAAHPPDHEVRLPRGEGTSWSCPHGIARWMRDCGCSTGVPEHYNQEWRAPLRAGLEVLKWAADETYGNLASPIFVDPWGARDRFVYVILGSTTLEDFLENETAGLADPEALRRAELLLDLQSNNLKMFTSCGWFFGDPTRIETIQVLKYAARVLDLLGELGLALPEEAYVPLLAEAKSNDPAGGNAATILAEIRVR